MLPACDVADTKGFACTHSFNAPRNAPGAHIHIVQMRRQAQREEVHCSDLLSQEAADSTKFIHSSLEKPKEQCKGRKWTLGVS